MASINRLSPILAIAVGVLHAGLAPVLAVSDVRPDIVLIAVVLVTCHRGPQAGATWAFVAGLTVNVLSAQPLGAIPLSLLAAASLTAVGLPLLATVRGVYPIVAVMLGSVVADGALLAIDRVTTGAGAGPISLEVVAIGAVLNGALAAAAVAAVWLARPRARGEVTAWTA